MSSVAQEPATMNVPRHVAIIMDGNRRWAKQKGLPAIAGHLQGAENLTKITTAASELGIEVLTVYAFSTENWNRPKLEIKALMHLLKNFLESKTPQMIEEGVRLSMIGDLTRLPKDVQKSTRVALEATKGGVKIDLVIALNYGGRDEIRRATKKIAIDHKEGKIAEEEITEELISRYLDTSSWEDPALIIRTSGESRVSNFLLWQMSYAEVVVTDVLWPDFCEKDLLRAILDYQNRELRIGK